MKLLIIDGRLVAHYEITGDTLFLNCDEKNEWFCLKEIEKKENRTFRYLAYLNLDAK